MRSDGHALPFSDASFDTVVGRGLEWIVKLEVVKMMGLMSTVGL